VRRDVAGHDGSGLDTSAASDAHAVEDVRADADPHVVFDDDGPRLDRGTLASVAAGSVGYRVETSRSGIDWMESLSAIVT